MKKNFILFITIIVFSFSLRLYGLSWDQGYHLHPDERAITMFSLPLQFPKTVTEFLSPQSSWNPHFFAYGSFPLYLLRIAGNVLSNFDPMLGQYDRINLLGRVISTFFDIGTLLLVFFLGKKLFNNSVGILAAFLYGISVLPIQLSHFYAVDTLLTFFIILTLYLLVLFYEKPTIKKAVLIGISFGFALATKISATVLFSSIGIALIIDFLLIFLKNPHHPKIWFPHLTKFFKKLLIEGVVILLTSVLTFIILEPYAIIDFDEFWRQTLQQRQMTYDAFTFPYTLQYVGKTPYLYELKNIFLWGQGPILAFISFLGISYITVLIIRKHLGWWQAECERSHDSSEVDKRWSQTIIILVFFWVYFLTVGNFAIGFMRYMLPLYPLLSLFGALFSITVYNFISDHINTTNTTNIKYYKYFNKKIVALLNYWYLLVVLVFIGSILVWPLSFMSIYSRPNTRVLASNWIYQNIPLSKTLAVEHWDDQLPLGGSLYKTLTLPLYDPDTPQKWEIINDVLRKTDYIIIASNRLYIPLQGLTTCEQLPIGRCYQQTAEYYRRLFNEENVILSASEGSRFKKVAEFTSYPQFSILNFKFPINDSSADESFTVYDHPKVIVYERII